MKQNIVILGMQWGDEGKGKIVDVLTRTANYVVRYHGGHNAGHTLVVNNKKIILHLVPSGILHNHVICLLGNGVVISPQGLIDEINMLSGLGISLDGRLFISHHCPLILSYHIKMDILREHLLDTQCIGTTKKGIGPAYEDKVSRFGLQVRDLYKESVLREKLKRIVDYYNFQFVHYYKSTPVNYDTILEELLLSKKVFKNRTKDIALLLQKSEYENKKIIFEGAQGALLDLDHGTFPYVTSSNSTIGGIFTGSGARLQQVHFILGIVKAYCTRVGSGPFPTELTDLTDDYFVKVGKEFGSTTGRRRRTGWLDLVLLKRMVILNSISSLCLTKLDVLDGLSEIKVCIAYKNLHTDQVIKNPFSCLNWDEFKPVYHILTGWNKSIKGITIFSQLPFLAQQYISYIEHYIGHGVSIDMISTGPDRLDTIIVRDTFNIEYI